MPQRDLFTNKRTTVTAKNCNYFLLRSVILTMKRKQKSFAFQTKLKGIPNGQVCKDHMKTSHNRNQFDGTDFVFVTSQVKRLQQFIVF